MAKALTAPTQQPSLRLPLGTPLRWLLLGLGPLVIFGLFMVLVGVDPLNTYTMMLRSALGDLYGISEVLIRATPFILTGLATALPARVGMVNVGGEGQLVMGALATAAVAVLLGSALPGAIFLPLLIVAGMVGGAFWSGFAGWLRVRLGLNETIGTLLLNYVATLTAAYCVHSFLKDPASFNWPFSPPLPDQARLMTFFGTRLHWGVLLGPIAAVAVWYLLNRTVWGLHMRVVGGNVQAARRAGLNVERIQLYTFLLAGALAGLAGMIEVAGVEGRLRPTTGIGFGYVGFLAAWMVGHNPLWLIGSSLLLAVIAVSGDALQITAGLPASSTNILMALVLIGVLLRLKLPGATKSA